MASPFVSLVVSLLREPEIVAAVRDAVGGAARDEWLTLTEAARLAGVSSRVLSDERRRGRLVLGGAGRKPLVQRSELERWIATRPARAAAPVTSANDTANDDDPRAAGKLAALATAARVGSR